MKPIHHSSLLLIDLSESRRQNTVIESTEDELDTGEFNLGWMNKGATASYKVDIPLTGAYEVLY